MIPAAAREHDRWWRWTPPAVVGGVAVVNLWMLRAETTAVQYVNDSAVHFQMVRWAQSQIHEGRVPLDGWFPNLGLGSAHFHHYQSLPHVLTAYVAQLVGAGPAFRGMLYLLLGLWPVAVYIAARGFGFSRGAAMAAAVVSPLITSVPGHGFEHGSYVWRGYGLWSQLFGMWLLPIAWVLGWRAVTGRGSYAAAAAVTALTVACHFLTGYLALLMLGVWILVGSGRWRGRIFRGAVVAGGALLMAAWVVVPLFTDQRWISDSVYFKHTFFTDSYGAGKVLGWLVSGRLFDAGRLPVVTVLVLVGLVDCGRRVRHDDVSRALVGSFAVSLVLFIGRHPFGPLIDLLPGHQSLLLHRYIMGVHLAGILLAGAGAAWVGRALADLATARWERIATGTVALAAVAVFAGGVAPAFAERFRYDDGSAGMIRSQQRQERTDGRDLAALVNRAEALGGGRVYAGLRSNWGADYRVGLVPVYSVLAGRDADAIGFTLRVASLSQDVETIFDETNPQHYPLFNVRYLLLPSERQPPIPATLLERRGRHTLWQVATTGYLDVVDTTAPIYADRGNLATTMKPFLQSTALLASNTYPTVVFPGTRVSAPTTVVGVVPSGPAGRVDQEFDLGADGTYGGRIVANRAAVVLLRSSYDPRWKVLVDGVAVEPQMIAPSFVGVAVSPGTHAVLFHYQPYPRYPLLFGLGAMTLVGLVVVPSVWPRVIARRRATAGTRSR